MTSTPHGAGEVESRPTSTLRLHRQATLVPELSLIEYRALSSSIAEHGLLVCLDVTAEGVVLDGRARLAAVRELGLEHVPVRIVAPSDCVSYMVRVAIERRNLTPSQKAALAVRYAGYEAKRAESRARQLANLRQSAEVATLPPRGRTRDELAAFSGASPRTVQDAISVYEHDGALFDEVVAGKIDVAPAARRVKRRLRDAGLSPPPPLPGGLFEVILADPPWQMGSPDSASAPEQHYATLPIPEIAALQIPAAESAVCFLWAVNCLLREALEVLEAWGFTYKAQLAWVKDRPGIGQWVRNQHELLLIGRKGSFPAPDPEDRPSSLIEAKRRAHSQKPTRVYELIERMYPHSLKLELFARGTQRPGWVAWGNEVEQASSEEAPTSGEEAGA